MALRMGPNQEGEIGRAETESLIRSDKIEGKTVYGADRQKIGMIETVMVEKATGRVAYAVLSFGGFLGLGTDRYPLPWSVLRYDDDLSGYVIHLSSEQFKNAPRYAEKEALDWDHATRSAVNRFYGGTPYPM